MLEIIREEYYWAIKNLKGVELNMRLAQLIDDLERFCGCIKTEEFKQLYVKLYRKKSYFKSIIDGTNASKSE